MRGANPFVGGQSQDHKRASSPARISQASVGGRGVSQDTRVQQDQSMLPPESGGGRRNTPAEAVVVPTPDRSVRSAQGSQGFTVGESPGTQMEVGEGSVVSLGPLTGGAPELHRSVFDLNNTAAHSLSTGQSSGADGRLATPHVVFSSVRADDYVARSGLSTPRTPHRAPSDASSLPEHLHAQFFDWLRSRSLLLEAEGFQTPQSKKTNGVAKCSPTGYI